MRRAIIGLVALLAACGPAKVDPDRPESYAMHLAVTPAAEGQVQRLILPPAAIAASRRNDLADVRIFDAAGKPLALARDDSFGALALRRSNPVPVSPIAMPGPIRPSGLSVRIDEAEQSVLVDQVNVDADTEVHPRTALLFDTRKLDEPAVALRLDARLPTRRLVEVNVEQSSDLKQWHRLASRSLFSFGKEANARPRLVIGLPGTLLKDSYLRVSWTLASDFVIDGGTIDTVSQVPPPRSSFPSQGARLEDARTLTFSVPRPLSAALVRLTGSGKDGIVPLSLQARGNRERPWVEIASGVLRDGQSLDLALGGTDFDDYRLVADPRSAGFAAKPRIELLAEPVALLAAFNANGPYRLAVGRADAADRFFAASEILGAQKVERIPEASVEAPATPILSLGAQDEDSPVGWRKLTLWAVLLAATAVLALAAYRLMKADAPKAPTG